MPFDRYPWKATFSKHGLPPWPCPSRGSVGTIGILEGSLVSAETARSRRKHNEPQWHPEWIEGRFTCLLRCGRTGCAEIMAVAGRYDVREDFDEVDGQFIQEYVDDYRPTYYYRPTYFDPAPPMFSVPHDCPAAVKESILSSFSLYWSDPGACMNRLRSAVEALLTELKIPRFARIVKVGKKGHLRRLALADRIAKLPPAHRNLADRLHAIRWLGNAGSHPGEISQDDVLDAVEILGHVFREHYGRHDEAWRDLTRRINRRKGSSRKGPGY